MALTGTYETYCGVKAQYIRILALYLDWATKSAKIQIGIYNTKEDRDAGKGIIEMTCVDLNGSMAKDEEKEDFNIFNESDVRKIAYEYMKTKGFDKFEDA